LTANRSKISIARSVIWFAIADSLNSVLAQVSSTLKSISPISWGFFSRICSKVFGEFRKNFKWSYWWRF